jgi:hypothetical protein
VVKLLRSNEKKKMLIDKNKATNKLKITGPNFDLTIKPFKQAIISQSNRRRNQKTLIRNSEIIAIRKVNAIPINEEIIACSARLV